MSEKGKHPSAYLTTEEAAQKIGVSERTVIRWIRNGLLRAFRLQSVTRISSDDFDEFLARNTNNVEEDDESTR